MEALRKEQDPEIFSASLLSFAARREVEGQAEVAALLYQRLAKFAEAPAEIRQRAQSRADALQGNGPVGAQAEVLVSRFSKEAMNPAPIVAMGIAGSLFKVSRALSLSSLRHAPIDRIVSRATANTIGLFTESAAFTLTAKSVSQGLGHQQDWSLPALKREWLAGTILLGSIKAGGALGVETGRSFAGLATRTESVGLQRGLAVATGLIQPLGLYGGILLSHQIEAGIGLRPAQGAANTLVDGAATLLHLYVGGRLAQSFGADRLNRAATEIEWRIGQPPASGNAPLLARWLNATPAIAMAAKAGESWEWGPRPAKPLRAQAYNGNASNPLAEYLHEARFIEDFIRRLPDQTADHLKTLIGNYPPFSKNSVKHRFMLTLGRSSISHESEILNAAIPTLAEALKFSDTGSPASSYSHWLTKQIFERSVQHSDSTQLDILLRFLGDGGKILDLEAQMASIYPGFGLPQGPPPTPRFWVGREGANRQIRELSLSNESKLVLSKWVASLTATPRSPLSISDLNLLDRLSYQQGLDHSIPGRMEQIDRTLQLAGRSPLGLARITRLQVLLENSTDVLLGFKLEDLADPSSTLRGRLHPWTAPETSEPAQSNAYLGDRAPLALLAEMRSRRADMLNPEKVESRQSHRQAVLDALFPMGVAYRSLTAETLTEAFQRLGDPTSLAIARALRNREFQLDILPAKGFQHRYHELSSGNVAGTESAYYFPPTPTRTKGVMLLRQPEFTVYSLEASREALFNLMGNIVHEYRHHLDIRPDQRRTPHVHFYQEMNAYFTEFLWKAGHGDVGHYSIWTSDSSLGPAMRFHDFYERVYGHWWKTPATSQAAAWAGGRQGP